MGSVDAPREPWDDGVATNDPVRSRWSADRTGTSWPISPIGQGLRVRRAADG